MTIWTLVKTSLWWNDELRLKFDQPLRWTNSYSMCFVFVGQDITFSLYFCSSFSFIDDDYDPSGKPFRIPCLLFRIPCFSCSLVKIWSIRCFSFLIFLHRWWFRSEIIFQQLWGSGRPFAEWRKVGARNVAIVVLASALAVQQKDLQEGRHLFESI